MLSVHFLFYFGSLPSQCPVKLPLHNHLPVLISFSCASLSPSPLVFELFPFTSVPHEVFLSLQEFQQFCLDARLVFGCKHVTLPPGYVCLSEWTLGFDFMTLCSVDSAFQTSVMALLRTPLGYFGSIRSLSFILWSVFNTLTPNNFLLQLNQQSTYKNKATPREHFPHQLLTLWTSRSCLFFQHPTGQSPLPRIKIRQRETDR